MRWRTGTWDGKAHGVHFALPIYHLDCILVIFQLEHAICGRNFCTPLERVESTQSPILRSMENEKVGLRHEEGSMLSCSRPPEIVCITITITKLRVPVSGSRCK